MLDFRGQGVGILQIGRALGVSHVLETAVRVAGNFITIMLRLIEASTGLSLWTEEYEADISASGSLFGIQDSIAGAVASALKLEFGSAGRLTESDVAYTLCLRSGDLGWNVNQPDNYKAEALLKQAIEFDSGFARAHARLASIYGWRVQVLGAERMWADSAVVAATQATDLDREEREAWAALGSARFIQGQLEEAVYAYHRATEVSPTWGKPADELSFIYLVLARFDDSLEAAARSIELWPSSSSPLRSVGMALLQVGDLKGAQRWLLRETRTFRTNLG